MLKSANTSITSERESTRSSHDALTSQRGNPNRASVRVVSPRNTGADHRTDRSRVKGGGLTITESSFLAAPTDSVVALQANYESDSDDGGQSSEILQQLRNLGGAQEDKAGTHTAEKQTDAKDIASGSDSDSEYVTVNATFRGAAAFASEGAFPHGADLETLRVGSPDVEQLPHSTGDAPAPDKREASRTPPDAGRVSISSTTDDHASETQQLQCCSRSDSKSESQTWHGTSDPRHPNPRKPLVIIYSDTSTAVTSTQHAPSQGVENGFDSFVGGGRMGYAESATESKLSDGEDEDESDFENEVISDLRSRVYGAVSSIGGGSAANTPSSVSTNTSAMFYQKSSRGTRHVFQPPVRDGSTVLSSGEMLRCGMRNPLVFF
jgi:hypothetical protein